MTGHRRRAVLKGIGAAAGAGLIGSGWAATHPEATERHWDYFIGGESYAEIDQEDGLEDSYDAFYQFDDRETLDDYGPPIAGLISDIPDDTDLYVAIEYRNMGLSGAHVDVHVPEQEQIHGTDVDEVRPELIADLEDGCTDQYSARWVQQLLDDAYGR